MNDELHVEVAKALAVARRLLRRGPEALSPEDVAIWTAVLQAANIQACDVMPALVGYMESESWFPAPSQIIERARALARRRQLDAIKHQKSLPAPEPERRSPEQLMVEAVAIQANRERVLRRLGEWDDERERSRTVLVGGEPTPVGDLLAAGGVLPVLVPGAGRGRALGGNHKGEVN